MKYLLPIILFLALALPVHAADSGPGVMVPIVLYDGGLVVTGAGGQPATCWHCWMPISEADFSDHRYVPGGRIYTCPKCGYTNKEIQLGYLEYLKRQGYK